VAPSGGNTTRAQEQVSIDRDKDKHLGARHKINFSDKKSQQFSIQKSASKQEIEITL